MARLSTLNGVGATERQKLCFQSELWRVLLFAALSCFGRVAGEAAPLGLAPHNTT